MRNDLIELLALLVSECSDTGFLPSGAACDCYKSDAAQTVSAQGTRETAG